MMMMMILDDVSPANLSVPCRVACASYQQSSTLLGLLAVVYPPNDPADGLARGFHYDTDSRGSGARPDGDCCKLFEESPRLCFGFFNQLTSQRTLNSCT